MKKYRGYYIDGSCFKNQKEIDEFLKEQAINSFKIAVELFCKYRNMEASIYESEKAEVLVKQFGFTWGEVEELEIATMEAIS